MEDILRPLYQERASKKETLGILLIEKRKTDSPVTDDLDAILFIICLLYTSPSPRDA